MNKMNINDKDDLQFINIHLNKEQVAIRKSILFMVTTGLLGTFC